MRNDGRGRTQLHLKPRARKLALGLLVFLVLLSAVWFFIHRPMRDAGRWAPVRYARFPEDSGELQSVDAALRSYLRANPEACGAAGYHVLSPLAVVRVRSDEEAFVNPVYHRALFIGKRVRRNSPVPFCGLPKRVERGTRGTVVYRTLEGEVRTRQTAPPLNGCLQDLVAYFEAPWVCPPVHEWN